MRCYFNECAGEHTLSPCCHDCPETECPERCPFKDRTACIWLTEGKEYDTERTKDSTGAQDQDPD